MGTNNSGSVPTSTKSEISFDTKTSDSTVSRGKLMFYFVHAFLSRQYFTFKNLPPFKSKTK